MERIQIKKYGINGEGIGYLRKKPVFVEYAMVDEIVDVEIVKQEKTYMIAQLVNIVRKSQHRIKDLRDIDQSGTAGLLHMSLKQQQRMKQELVIESVQKYAGIPLRSVEFIANPKPIGYRNQLKMPLALVDGEIKAGFYKRNTRYFVPVDKDVIHDPLLEKVRIDVLRILNQFHVPIYEKNRRDGLRFLVLRILNQQIQCTLVTSQFTIKEEVIEALSHLELISVHQSINTLSNSQEIMVLPLKKLYGKDSIQFTVNRIKVNAHPYSFFQLNTVQAAQLYQKAVDMIRPAQTLIETYCGLGIMSLMAKDKVSSIIGCDINAPSIKNANSNAAINKCPHVKFVVSDSAQFLKRESKQKQIDYVIVDPPRTGLDEAMLETLIKGKIKHVIYISCNPSTLGKNINVLKSKYRIEKTIVFDMFSQTPHVETLMLLTRI